MAINKYPYTNFNEYNLDWIIAEIRKLHEDWSDFQILNTIRFEGLWNITKQYPAWSLVTNNNVGYISVKPVPSGIDITESDYWKEVYNYDAVIPDIMQRIVDLEGQIDDFLLISKFPGNTDAEKVQNAFDYSKTHYNTALIVDKDFDLTGSTIDLNKGLYISDSDYRRYRSKTTFIGIAGGKFTKKDSGFFFTASAQSGDFLFDHVTFEGDVVLDGVNDHDLKAAGNSVFDCSKIIRLTTIGCSYILVGNVFDGENAVDNYTNMQSIISDGDLCTYSNSLVHFGQSYGVVIQNATIENCNFGLYYEHTTTPQRYIISSSVKGCCIESCEDGAIYIDDNDSGNISINSFEVSDCYFEANGTTDIKFNCFMFNIKISKCKTAFTANNNVFFDHRCYPNTDVSVDHIMGTGSVSGCLIAKGHSTNATFDPIKLINCSNTAGSIVNDPLYGIDTHRYGENYYRVSAAKAGITDANNLFQKSYTGTLIITSADTISNLPTGATNGVLTWFGEAASCVQIFVSAADQKAYRRCRFTGVGWGSWAAF